MSAGPVTDGSCAVGARLERAYRLALWLQDSTRDRCPADADTHAFAIQVAAAELVEVLDEARALLVRASVTPAGMPMPVRSSAPPDR